MSITPTKKKTSLWVKIALVAVGTFVIIAACSSMGRSTTPTPSFSPASSGAAAGASVGVPTFTYEAAAPAETVAPEPSAAPTGPLTTIPGTGTYLVGTDVVAGNYRSPRPQQMTGIFEGKGAELCAVDIKDANGKILDVKAQNSGQSLVTLVAGTTFHTTGCEAWVKR